MRKTIVDIEYLRANADKRTRGDWAVFFDCSLSTISAACTANGIVPKSQGDISAARSAAARKGAAIRRAESKRKYLEIYDSFDTPPDAHQLAEAMDPPVSYWSAMRAAKQYGFELAPTDGPTLRNQSLEEGWAVTPLQQQMARMAWVPQDGASA